MERVPFQRLYDEFSRVLVQCGFAAGRAQVCAKIFAENCAACHGPEGKGNPALGTPNLTDELWLYAGDKVTVANTVRNGRGGVMPAWATRLDPEAIKELAVYVHSLGGGQ